MFYLRLINENKIKYCEPRFQQQRENTQIWEWSDFPLQTKELSPFIFVKHYDFHLFISAIDLKTMFF